MFYLDFASFFLFLSLPPRSKAANRQQQSLMGLDTDANLQALQVLQRKYGDSVGKRFCPHLKSIEVDCCCPHGPIPTTHLLRCCPHPLDLAATPSPIVAHVVATALTPPLLLPLLLRMLPRPLCSPTTANPQPDTALTCDVTRTFRQWVWSSQPIMYLFIWIDYTSSSTVLRPTPRASPPPLSATRLSLAQPEASLVMVFSFQWG